MKYWSIRVVEGNDISDATNQVLKGNFCGEDPMCDVILPADDTVSSIIQNAAHALTLLRKDEPMDGDETEKLGEHLSIELDWVNGNMTKEEYKDAIVELLCGKH